MNKTIFDIDCEPLDFFFSYEIEKISPQSKSDLPRDVSFKLFRGGGKFNTASTSKLGFLAKLYILWKALRKRWWILIEDEENGLTPGQFMELRKAYKKRDYGMDRANVLISSGSLVLASKELGECMSYLNLLSVSPAYKYLIKGKNKESNPAEEWNRQMEYVVKFISFYEANKKSWVAATGVSIPEWLVLTYLYHRRETNGSPIYKDYYRRAYQSSPTKLRRCFSVLQHKGLIQKTGQSSAAKMSITPLGKDTVNTILTKYALNCS